MTGRCVNDPNPTRNYAELPSNARLLPAALPQADFEALNCL